MNTRQKALTDWQEQSVKVGLHTMATEIVMQTAVDASLLRQWHRVGLPKDTSCIQNAVLTSLTARWPLLIDPHGMARKWIKGIERTNQLRVLSPSHHDFVRALENAVTTGRVVLVDNAIAEDGSVHGALDPLLRPIANGSYNLPQTVKISNEVNYHKKFRYVQSDPEKWVLANLI